MTSTPQHEPVVSLPSGAAVLLAVYELVTRLQQRGHTLAVDADGDVRVTPDDDLDGDVQYLLDVNAIDVVALLVASRRVM